MTGSTLIQIARLRRILSIQNVWSAFFGGALLISSFPCLSQQDSTDLIDSPLTLSLARTVNNDASQNVLIVDQYGIHNTTNIIQAANSSNLIVVTQFGNSNSADITQLGFGNHVDLVQSGEENTLEIVQQGDFNLANINQLGEQNFTVHQIGNDMVVNITQYKK
ncbi:minor curlin subunit [Aliiglaciecola lipolytica]|uniref:Minor curlin subunit n=1 Tax=Aliiglaciecola lipolytica E3 TaxID=1127673 RepID=K6YCU2_9ALTE|nr:minor curlin subunit [Aliiglaciecola lipolytica]GAC14448.1 minor curlin subunit [Aliiglaciecola lipolytica E3]